MSDVIQLGGKKTATDPTGPKSTNLGLVMDMHALHRRMIQDPDLTGDLLLVGLGLVEILTQSRERGRKGPIRKWYGPVVEFAFGAQGTSRWYRAKSAISDDRPRYVPANINSRSCTAPMIRREGLCGKNAYQSWVERDPITGEGIRVGFCTRHYSHELRDKWRTLTAEWEANGEPHPPANTGGVLARYFKGLDPMYTWAANGREPEVGGKEATLPKPALRLVRGEA